MKKRKGQSRREFLVKAGMLGSLPLLPSPVLSSSKNNKLGAGEKDVKFNIGVASWGLRKLSFDEVIKAMQDMQLEYISLKSMHLPFDLSAKDLRKRVETMRDAGLHPYAPGVVYMNSKEEADMAFEYTKNADLDMIVGVPAYDIMDYVELLIKTYNISVAIHCHGPDNLPFPSPEDAFERLEGRDDRFGICVDVSHVVRSGMDPVDQLKIVRPRLLDMHIWDVSEASKEGKAVRPGKGVLDFKAILSTLVGFDYAGSLSIEYGSEAENPVPAYIETKGYIEGVLAGLYS
ncbi:MAG: sugar phosphate isomerase/epimerase family protein [bacterium]